MREGDASVTTLTIQVPPGVEQRLRELAAERGLAVDDFVREVLEARAAPIVRDPKRCAGDPILAGTRTAVHEVVSYARRFHWDLERVRAEALPHLSLEQVHAAIAWYREHAKSSVVVAAKYFGEAEGEEYAWTRIFLWQKGKVRRAFSLGGKYSYLGGINDKGDVVGSTDLGKRDENGDALDCAILRRNGKNYDLNRCIPANSGWYLEDASGINNQGQIVGIGFRGHAFVGTAFLLTPVK
jgi:uncharacterized protein (DUF433 family)